MQRHLDRISSAFTTARRSAIETVYPKRCAGCGWRGVWLCDRCLLAQPVYEKPWCLRCGVPRSEGDCRCKFLADEIVAVRSVGPYEGWLKTSIHRVKYQGERARIPFLAGLMVSSASEYTDIDAVTAVPLHPARLKERGFNQSSLLAEHVAASLGLPLFDDLTRIRNTEHQVGLAVHERADNVRGAFMAQGTSPERLLLVDDVVTSGATLAECQLALCDAGARTVDMVTLA